MRTKNLAVAAFLFILTVAAYIAASIFFCYTTEPAVKEGEFPFAITYEYKGETKTLSGVLKCEYYGSSTIHGEHERGWEGEVIYDNPENLERPHVIDESVENQTLLSLQANMEAGYFMGDPLHADHYADYGLEGPEPYIEYYDYKNNISLGENEESRDEILESIGFKILDCTYPEPIENSFTRSGISYEADNVIIFVAILFVFFILCLIFVRRDVYYDYTNLDKLGIVLNCLIAIIALPIITITCIFFGLVESNVHLINQVVYNIPPFAILCLALSVVFRRQGFSKAGFFIQFAGILPFVAVLLLESIA